MIVRTVVRATRTILFLISGTRKPLMFPKPLVRPYRVPDLACVARVARVASLARVARGRTGCWTWHLECF